MVDSRGGYVEHSIDPPVYLCVACGSPAVDLSQVPQEMAAEAEEAVAPVAAEVLCPVCETRVTVLPGEDCPSCGAELSLV